MTNEVEVFEIFSFRMALIAYSFFVTLCFPTITLAKLPLPNIAPCSYISEILFKIPIFDNPWNHCLYFSILTKNKEQFP